MAKSLNTVLVSLLFLGISMMSCTPKNVAEGSSTVDSFKLSSPESNNFEGKYISPQPGKIDKGSYYTGLMISAIKENDSLSVQFSSAKIKKQVCCSFTGIGYAQKDTLFVPVQAMPGYKNVVMIITHNPNDTANQGSIMVSTLDSNQANALMNFCCAGASLSGNYFPCDLSLFQTDTSKANENADLLNNGTKSLYILLALAQFP